MEKGLDAAGFYAILAALPFAVYGLDRNLIVLYNNGRHALAEFLAEEETEPQGELIGSSYPLGAKLIGSCLLDHIPIPERQPLRDLSEALQAAGPDSDSLPRGVDFLHASASGLRRLRVMTTCVPGSPGGIEFLLTCHESEVSGPAADAAPASTARLDVARQLAATLNHEINNPLFIVSATLEDLLAETEEPSTFIVSATLEDLLAETEEPSTQRRLRAALDSVWRVASAVKQLQEIRQVITTAYIEGLPMVDLDASLSAGKQNDG
jgi:signal transduction histidine kinase